MIITPVIKQPKNGGIVPPWLVPVVPTEPIQVPEPVFRPQR